MDVGEDNVSGVARTHLLRVPLRIPLRVPLRIAPPCCAPYPCSAIALHRHRAMFFLCSVAQKKVEELESLRKEATCSRTRVRLGPHYIDPCSMLTLSWIRVVCPHY